MFAPAVAALPGSDAAARSASFLTRRSEISRISTMPGENRAHYHRNLLLASASVATTRVSVRATEVPSLTASARSVHTIFT